MRMAAMCGMIPCWLRRDRVSLLGIDLKAKTKNRLQHVVLSYGLPKDAFVE